jgi:hypothetical protein
VNGRRHNHIALLLAGCLLLGLGCGLKGPPVPPETTVPPNITDLKAVVTGDAVRLSWTLPREEDGVFHGLEFFRVYRYQAPVSHQLCEGCPIPFQQVLDIHLDNPAPAWVEEGRMLWEDRVEPGHRYAYMITVHHESGGVSKDSNVVQFVTEEKKAETD